MHILSYTSGGESQLSAGHLSIYIAPEVITHCAPDVVAADLHTSLSGIASLQSDGPFNASTSSLTPHSSIFNVPTVVLSKWLMGATGQCGLKSNTLDIIQPDLTNTISKARE